MNSEDKAVLANIATILVKDIGLDRKRTPKRCPLILFDDSDDELDEFICDMQMKRVKLSFNPVKKILNGISQCHYSLNLTALGTEIFQKSLHITEETYMKLIETLKPTIPDEITKISYFSISKESIISLGLWKAATDEHYHKISKRFELPRTICISIIKKFYNIMALNFQKFIKWPNNCNEVKFINNFENNPEISLIFNKLYGILGCKPISVFLEDQNDELPLLLHICCNGNGIITYCHITETNLFDETPLARIINGKEINVKIPNDYYLIGDCSFPLHKHLVTPFRDPSNEKKRNFNVLTERTVAIATDVFKKMFKRFHTLFALEATDLKEVRNIIKTICILNNLCQEFDDKCVLEHCDFEFGEQNRHKSSEDNVDGLTNRLVLMDSIL